MNFVVQTGVKSAGWEKKMPHLPLKSSGKLIGPWVVSALKDGAFSPISGNLFSLHINMLLSFYLINQLNKFSRIHSRPASPLGPMAAVLWVSV